MPSYSSGPKRDVEEFRRGFTVLQTLGNDSQGEGLYEGNGFVAVLAIGHHAWQIGYLGEPAAVVFTFDFDREGHLGNVPSGPAVSQGDGPKRPRGPLERS